MMKKNLFFLLLTFTIFFGNDSQAQTYTAKVVYSKAPCHAGPMSWNLYGRRTGNNNEAIDNGGTNDGTYTRAYTSIPNYDFLNISFSSSCTPLHDPDAPDCSDINLAVI